MSKKDPNSEERRKKLIDFAKDDKNFISPVIPDPTNCTKTNKKNKKEIEKQKKKKEKKQNRQKVSEAEKKICLCVKDGHIDMKKVKETVKENADCFQ